MMVASHPPPSSPHSRTMAKYVCGLLGLPCREAYLLTAETPNGFDDGHIACEVQIGGIWKLFDVAGDRYFTHMGAHLSLQDIIDKGFGLIEALGPTEADNDPGGNNLWHPGVYLRASIDGDRIRALTDERPIKPTSDRRACCRSAWQPNPGRRSTYRSGKSVRTSGATSKDVYCLSK